MLRIYFFIISVTFAASATADTSNLTLQGTWTVIAGEHGGQPMDAMNGGSMVVKENRFRIDTSSGNVLEGDLSLDNTTTPNQMVMLHDSGVKWRAIYQVTGNSFRMNYIDAKGPDPLPSGFRTSTDTEATVVVLQKN